MSKNVEVLGPTSLFLLRLWEEPSDLDVSGSGERREEQAGGSKQDGIAWHGRLLHVNTGEGHDFVGWPGLVAAIQGVMMTAHPHVPNQHEIQSNG